MPGPSEEPSGKPEPSERDVACNNWVGPKWSLSRPRAASSSQPPNDLNADFKASKQPGRHGIEMNSSCRSAKRVTK
eukprot:6919586-Alexandrium_andersonii.AAC.1